MATIRGLAALVFVALFGYFLAGPVLRSDDGTGPGPRRAAPTDSGDPDQQKPPRSGAALPDRLVNRYPRECLRPIARPEGSGLVAAYEDEQIGIVTPSGDAVATITDVAPVVRPPIAWSPSGRYIAAGPQGLFWDANGDVVLFANGEFAHGMVFHASGQWAWSPIADCGLAIQDGGLWATTIDPFKSGAGIELVEEGVLSFTFTPDGRRVVFVTGRPGHRGERALFTANLETGRIRSGANFGPRRCYTCSPTGDFRVGIRNTRLALFDRRGSFLRNITEVQTENGVWGETAPEWGPVGTGVLFERHMHLINQLWFLPEQSSAPHFVVALEPLTALTGLFDWSATPPTGAPVR